MIKIKDNFLVSKGKPVGVFLNMREYRKLIEQAEDLEDIKAFDEALKSKNNKFIPFEEVFRKIKNLRK